MVDLKFAILINEGCFEFNYSTNIAKLVPSLKHGRLNVLGIRVELLGFFIKSFVGIGFELGCDIQHAIRCGSIFQCAESKRASFSRRCTVLQVTSQK